MKKLVIGLALVSLIAVGAIAYAHGPGSWGGGHMMGQRYGGHMMGNMSGQGGFGYGHDEKFLNETREQRKEFHDKKFEYFEALRNPKTTTEDLIQAEKEIQELQEKIHAKAPQIPYGRAGGGGCW